ncbi:MAG: MarR family transcriptional regulator [Myxococcota bacterium]
MTRRSNGFSGVTADDERTAEDDLWPTAFGAWIKVGVVYQKTSRHLASRLRPLDLTVAQFDALANLYNDTGLTQQELARRLLVTKGNMTGLVGRLVERGWVRKRVDPRDGRAVRLALTSPGRKRTKKALLVQRELIGEMMHALRPGDVERLRAQLTRVERRIDAIADGR